MKRYITIGMAVAMLCMVLLPGCGPTAEEKAAGTYALDKQNLIAAAKAEMDENDPMSQQALSMLEEMNMTITLNVDGTASNMVNMMGQNVTASGTWKISGEAVTISVSAPGEEPESITGTLKGDTLELSPPKEGEMPVDKLIFKKQAAK